ncbi:MAG: hypothetical protein CMJ49_06055 [Planctomycetaceae bacterium]|nr:hypothetical protein [Planctomycetaceae bacterium]
MTVDSSNRLLIRFAPLIVMGLGVVAYWVPLGCPMFWDDSVDLGEEAAALLTIWPDATCWGSDDGILQRRPVVGLSFAINRALWGMDPAKLRLVNIAIHLLCALTLFGLVRRLMCSARLKEDYAHRATVLALCIAALWVVHPLLSETMMYVIQRTESLMGLFYLLTLYCVVRAWEGRGRWAWGAAAIVACGLGMGSKEVMFSAPLAALLLDRAMQSGSFGRALPARGWLYAGLAATWLILAGLLLWVPPSDSQGFGKGVAGMHYLQTQAGIILHYIRLCFIPHPLSLFYEDWPVVARFGDAWPWMLMVASLAALALALSWRRPAIGVAALAFFVILAPTSSFFPITTEFAAERRMYLPLACVIVLVVFGIDSALMRAGSRRESLRGFAGAAWGIVVVGLIVQTQMRARDYRDLVALGASSVANRPESLQAHRLYARALHDLGTSNPEQIILISDMAILHLRFVLEHSTNDLERARVMNDIANAYKYKAQGLKGAGSSAERTKVINHALDLFLRSIEIEPDRLNTHYNLGNLLVEMGELKLAIGRYRRALELDPEYGPAHVNLAAALGQSDQLEEALDHARLGVQHTQRFSAAQRIEAHRTLATALDLMGDTQGANEQRGEVARLEQQLIEQGDRAR